MARDLGAGTGEVHAAAEAVLRFWLEEVPAAKRFVRDEALDREIARRFAAVRAQVVAAQGACWRSDPRASLAAVILIDQFGRNLFRGSPQAFAADPLARALASEAIAKGWPAGMAAEQRQFLFMPFMHGETMADQVRALALFKADGGPQYAYARLHAAQIARFGRFPQRNLAIGRKSSADEEAFLAEPENSF